MLFIYTSAHTCARVGGGAIAGGALAWAGLPRPGVAVFGHSAARCPDLSHKKHLMPEAFLVIQFLARCPVCPHLKHWFDPIKHSPLCVLLHLAQVGTSFFEGIFPPRFPIFLNLFSPCFPSLGIAEGLKFCCIEDFRPSSDSTILALSKTST